MFSNFAVDKNSDGMGSKGWLVGFKMLVFSCNLRADWSVWAGEEPDWAAEELGWAWTGLDCSGSRFNWSGTGSDWPGVRLDWSDRELDWSGRELDWTGIEPDWLERELDWSGIEPDWLERELDWSSLRFFSLVEEEGLDSITDSLAVSKICHILYVKPILEVNKNC